MSPNEKSLIDRIRWGNVGRLLAVVAGGLILLFGTRLTGSDPAADLAPEVGLRGEGTPMRGSPGRKGLPEYEGRLPGERPSSNDRRANNPRRINRGRSRLRPRDSALRRQRHHKKRKKKRKRSPRSGERFYQPSPAGSRSYPISQPPASSSSSSEFTPG